MKRILVIDDQDDMRSMIAATLVVAGYSVRGATDGRDGILKLLIERPDLILCDIKMSGMDGYRTLEAIRRIPQDRGYPVHHHDRLGGAERVSPRNELWCG